MFHISQTVLENSKVFGKLIGGYENYDKLLKQFENLYKEKFTRFELYKFELGKSEFDKYGIYTGRQLLVKFWNRLNDKDKIYLFGNDVVNKIREDFKNSIEDFVKSKEIDSIHFVDGFIKSNEIYYLLNFDNPFT